MNGPGESAPQVPELAAEDRGLLLMAAAIGFTLFAIETGAGQLAGSQALKADALAFLASGTRAAWDAWSPNQPEPVKFNARAIVAAILVLAGSWTAITTLYQFFAHPVPDAGIMSGMGLLTLAANGLIIWRLWAQRTSGDTRVGVAWRSARTGAIGNAAVIIAAGLVGLLNSAAPDLVLGGVLVALFLSAAIPPARESLMALRGRREPPPRSPQIPEEKPDGDDRAA